MNTLPPPPVTATPPAELTAVCPDCGEPVRARADVRGSGVWVGEIDPVTFRVHVRAGCDLIRLSRALSAAAQEASRVQVFKVAGGDGA